MSKKRGKIVATVSIKEEADLNDINNIDGLLDDLNEEGYIVAPRYNEGEVDIRNRVNQELPDKNATEE